MQKKISIIIPVFNSELYVKQCIQSVIDQTYSDWELLVVDDGSTDGSMTICEEIRQSDERIRLFYQEHKGVSAARNLGLEKAEGEYVFFLDSDDMIHPCLLSEFIIIAEKSQAQLLMCRCRKFRTEQIKSILSDIAGKEKESREEWQIGESAETEEWFHTKYNEQMGKIGGKMMLRERIKDLRFDDKLVLGEDTLFIYFLISKGIKAAHCEEEWYYYRMHTQNVTEAGSAITDEQYTACCRIIRDNEYKKGNIRFAVRWEEFNTIRMEKSCSGMRRSNDKKKCCSLREKALAETQHKLFRLMEPGYKVLFYSCFYCYPVYILLRNYLTIKTKMRKKARDG